MRMYRLLFSGLLLISGAQYASAQIKPKSVKHVKVYFEPGMYRGWPANNGMWIWGNQILVGFSKGFHKNLGVKHNIDRDKPELHMLAAQQRRR